MRNRTPSPALLVAVLALVVAMGGTSYAALSIGRNSVGSKQLRSNAVKSAKVKNGSLLARDFKAGQLPAGAPGATGAAGPQGVAGPQGEAGPTQGKARGFSDPAAASLAVTDKFTITTTTPGSLYVSASLDTAVGGCTAAADCKFHFGLYVDGKPVPGTKVEVGYPANSGHGFQNLSTVGIAPGIEPGDHLVELRWIDFSGTVTGSFDQNYGNVGAILLGS
jgi:hypothetical protein